MTNKLNSTKGGSYGTFMTATRLFAYTLAVVVTFFGTGPFYGLTVDFVQDYAVAHYGPSMSEVVSLGWGAICGTLIFSFTAATLSTGLIMAGSVLFLRFFYVA